MSHGPWLALVVHMFPGMRILWVLGLAVGMGCQSGGEGDVGAGGGAGPRFPGAGTDPGAGPLKDAELFCYFGPDGGAPAAAVEYTFESLLGTESLHVRLTFDPGFVDNTYGVNAIGWESRRKGHTFEELVKSDHAVVEFSDGGRDVLGLKLDYITEDPSAPSGYASLGVDGGEGELLAGERAWVLAATSSLDRNLNERGYGDYLVDSPATDAAYTPNPDAPGWDYRLVYEAWIDRAAFAGALPPAPRLEFIHASPSKGADNTLAVTPGECPPDWQDCTDPDGCEYGGGGGTPGGECIANEYGEGCFDGNDNDCDGLADCDDSDCSLKCEEACAADGVTGCPTTPPPID